MAEKKPAKAGCKLHLMKMKEDTEMQVSFTS